MMHSELFLPLSVINMHEQKKTKKKTGTTAFSLSQLGQREACKYNSRE